MSGEPDGRAMLAAIVDYCRRTGMGEVEFGKLAAPRPFPGFIGLLRKRGTITRQTAAHVKAFMARWPDGCTAEQLAAERDAAAVSAAPRKRRKGGATALSIAAQVSMEAAQAAARREDARRTGGMHGGARLSLVEQIQSEMIDEPAQAVALLKRCWPYLWRRILWDAREAGVSPVRHLVSLIATGVVEDLDQIEAEAA